MDRMASEWEPEPIDYFITTRQSSTTYSDNNKEDKQSHRYYHHHEGPGSTEHQHQQNQHHQHNDRRQNYYNPINNPFDNPVDSPPSNNHNYNNKHYSPHDPYTHHPNDEYNTGKVSYDRPQYDANQGSFLPTASVNSYQLASNYQTSTNDRTSMSSINHTNNGEIRQRSKVIETSTDKGIQNFQRSADDSGDKNSLEAVNFVTTPLIMQVLNDEKIRLAASIQRTKEEAAATQNRDANALNENNNLGRTWTKSRKLSTLLRTDPRFTSLVGIIPTHYSTLSFGDHFETYRYDADTVGDGAKPGVHGFPGRKDLERFLKRGNEVDENGLYPIHEACVKYPNNAKLIGMMIRSTPKCTGYQVRRTMSRNLRRKSLSDTAITESNIRPPLKKRKSQGHLFGPNRFPSEGGQQETREGGEPSSGTKNNTNPLIGMCPIHICIANSASIEVLKLIVRANPKALSCPDANGMVPLSLAFRYHRSVETEYFNNMVNLLLAANPSAAKVLDARCNTSLHYACMTFIQAGGLRWRPRSGSISTNGNTESSSSSSTISVLPSRTESHPKTLSSSKNLQTDHSQNSKMESRSTSISSSRANSTRIIPFEILKGLTEANPKAIHIRNFNGHTPLDLAESSGEVDDISITFLQNVAYGVEEHVEEPPLDFF